MSKLAVLPNVEVTPAMVLDVVRDQLPYIKSIYIVIENHDDKWVPFFTTSSVAEIFFAGAVLQNNAVKAGTGQ